jgi:hypothetical protein
LGWYPRRAQYFASLDESAEIEQGDILWGVPSLRASHPAIADRFSVPGAIPNAEDLEPPALSDVLRGVRVESDAVMVMPHTCDFYGLEKGRTHRDRLVARVIGLARSGVEHDELLRSGEGYAHTFFVPSWQHPSDSARDAFVNLRQMTTVDASYLSRTRRLARLSAPALIALRRRLAHFFTDYAPSPLELTEADQRGGLIREARALVPVERLRAVLGDEATNQFLRGLFDPQAAQSG